MRPTLPWILGFGVLALMAGCREPLDFDRSLTADPDRGKLLYTKNCANTCHPANAFEKRDVKNFEQLAYTVREYYEKQLGPNPDYSQQDVFDISRYLDKQYYHFKRDLDW